MPSKDRLRPHDIGHFAECPLSELPADLGESSPLAISQPQTTCDLISKNTVLGGKDLVAKESSSSSTDPVMYASSFFQSIVTPPTASLFSRSTGSSILHDQQIQAA